MPPASPADFVDVLRQSRVLEPDQVDEIARGSLARFADARGLARDMIDRDLLTPYQVNQIFLDRSQDLVLGQYVLLERLGAGAMGQVFKARHRSLGRAVALKIVRKDRLAKPEVVKRFLREVQAAAQLKHPNVVLAFDADQIGTTHFIAMEYVEGIDLSRLVKTSGPLPVEQACEFIGQAALGLQHAHEKGLVHRDIKPANLLVTRLPPPGSEPSPRTPGTSFAFLTEQSGSASGTSRGPVVKILDMGLARLRPGMEDEATAGLTQEGVVVGTVDFLAPEQAMNASTVDIRADIYGLGCTFYYLLTGQAPFAGSSVMEKLLKHRCQEPPPVEQLRPAVSPALGAVIRKLMAKRAEDRYQTPSEVALAISALAETSQLEKKPSSSQATPQAILVGGVEMIEGAFPSAIPVTEAASMSSGQQQTLPPDPIRLASQDTAGPWDAITAAPSPEPSQADRKTPSRSQVQMKLAALGVLAVVFGGLFALLIWLILRRG